jgi:hypothetical protein
VPTEPSLVTGILLVWSVRALLDETETLRVDAHCGSRRIARVVVDGTSAGGAGRRQVLPSRWRLVLHRAQVAEPTSAIVVTVRLPEGVLPPSVQVLSIPLSSVRQVAHAGDGAWFSDHRHLCPSLHPTLQGEPLATDDSHVANDHSVAVMRRILQFRWFTEHLHAVVDQALTTAAGGGDEGTDNEDEWADEQVDADNVDGGPTIVAGDQGPRHVPPPFGEGRATRMGCSASSRCTVIVDHDPTLEATRPGGRSDDAAAYECPVCGHPYSVDAERGVCFTCGAAGAAVLDRCSGCSVPLHTARRPSTVTLIVCAACGTLNSCKH